MDGYEELGLDVQHCIIDDRQVSLRIHLPSDDDAIRWTVTLATLLYGKEGMNYMDTDFLAPEILPHLWAVITQTSYRRIARTLLRKRSSNTTIRSLRNDSPQMW